MADARPLVLKHKRATLERIEKYISDIYFADANLFGKIDTKIEDDGGERKLQISRCNVKDMKSEELDKCQDWTTITTGEAFKPLWSQHWVRVKVTVPLDVTWYLFWDLGGAESLVVNKSGKPLQGLSDQRKVFLLDRGIGEEQTYYIQVSCTTLFGAGKNGMINAPDKEQVYTLNGAHLFRRNNIAYACYMDLKVLHELAKDCSEDTSLCYDALYTANDIINLLTKSSTSEQYIKAHNIAKEFFNSGQSNTRDTIHAIGNCHIDCAWLWPVAETRRKVARSWSTTASLINSGTRFNFAASQVVQFAWMKELYPDLYIELKKLIRQGNFNPVGGTWVEMDTNIPSGESLIRQFLYGRQFYKNEFGVKSDILWLPDTFGYSGQLPQIMKICDIKYFLSQKLSWNLTNSFPHHTFYWKGIDGSKVLAHFPPCDTYTSSVEVNDILKAVKNNKDKGRTHNQMLLFGHGDGGGGPTPEMIERLTRLNNVGDMPKVVRSSPDKFFASVEEEGTDRLCEWWGELYFELHRGTYTTWSKVKDENRRCELKMRELEMMGVRAHLNNIPVPEEKEVLVELWKLILFNQFHDILPGTSIGQVFIDACHDYTKFHVKWEELYSKLVKELSSTKNIAEATSEATSEAMSHVINPYNWPIEQVMEFGGKLVLVSVPQIYIGPPAIVQCLGDVKLVETKSGYLLENEYIRAIFSHTGELLSVIERSSNRECLSGPGNSFVIFDDIPLFWDAWDVMEYHTETRTVFPPTKASIKEDGGLRACLIVHVPLGQHGHVLVQISLDHKAKYLKFRANVEWKANRKFLKVDFPLSVTAMEATYDIQSGCIKRPTHQNTSWDMAKFEVSGHKWSDLSEPNFGVSVLSKSKYGFSARSNALTLSLLRSSKSPDDTADIGSHDIVYGLMPHVGPLDKSGVAKESYNLNHPLVMRAGNVVPTPLFNIHNADESALSSDFVVVQAIKKSEEGDFIVLRLYEPYGNTVTVHIQPMFSATGAALVNGVEREINELSLTADNSLKIKLTPFEIKSVSFKLKDSVTTATAAKRSTETLEGSSKRAKQ